MISGEQPSGEVTRDGHLTRNFLSSFLARGLLLYVFPDKRIVQIGKRIKFGCLPEVLLRVCVVAVRSIGEGQPIKDSGVLLISLLEFGNGCLIIFLRESDSASQLMSLLHLGGILRDLHVLAKLFQILLCSWKVILCNGQGNHIEFLQDLRIVFYLLREV